MGAAPAVVGSAAGGEDAGMAVAAGVGGVFVAEGAAVVGRGVFVGVAVFAGEVVEVEVGTAVLVARAVGVFVAGEVGVFVGGVTGVLVAGPLTEMTPAEGAVFERFPPMPFSRPERT